MWGRSLLRDERLITVCFGKEEVPRRPSSVSPKEDSDALILRPTPPTFIHSRLNTDTFFCF